MDIVDSRQNCREDFVGYKEMMKIGPAEILAGIAAAARVDWKKIALVIFVGQADSAATGKQGGTSGVTGRNDAVKHINSGFDRVDNFIRPTDSHQISGFIFWQRRQNPF